MSAELRAHSGTEGPGYNGEQLEIVFLLKGARYGNANCKFGSREHSVPTLTGTTWICPAGVQADEIRTSRSDLMAAHIYLPDASLAAIAETEECRTGSKELRSAVVARDEMIEHFGRVILGEMIRESSASLLLVDSATTMLVAWLLQHYAESRSARIAPRSNTSLDASRLNRVMSFMEAHLDDEISLSDLAAVACMSEFHFSRAFSATVGCPPHRYLSRRRLERAKSMILTGSASLAEIAQLSGFSSQAAFTRAFHRTMGVSPGQYRRGAL
ncbi:helix-turn-helix domain-containing protein [Starkeya nomas]|uniref:helix-turn-helix domain-containing protein n=1 Tax=Starkeya nomas TaxID=2666134 RepID=UPI0013579D20|nr:AraC family transcriptional regulator [Starkeya nomas]